MKFLTCTTTSLSALQRLQEPLKSIAAAHRSSSSSSSSSAKDPAPTLPNKGMNQIPVFSTLASPWDNPPTEAVDWSAVLQKSLSLWPGTYHSPITNALWDARSKILERMMFPSNKDNDPPQTELLTRTPAQSRTTIVYNFSSDYILREQYRDPWNEVRIEKLLEDLDALAEIIAVKHCSDDDEGTTRPLLLVTASVDKIVLKKPIYIDMDMTISGAVTRVGNSSIEIQMVVSQTQESSTSSDHIALTADFTFVALDSKTQKAATVNRLSPQTEHEKQLWELGEARDKLRKNKRDEKKRKSESVVEDEFRRLKSLLAEGQGNLPVLADQDSILIRNTLLENSLICQPQQRNMQGTIFGGFLMHLAFELAFSTAYAFVGQMPRFLQVDRVDFLKPVDVGDFLRLKSCVLYTQIENPEQPLINIEVIAHVTRPELRTSENAGITFLIVTSS